MNAQAGDAPASNHRDVDHLYEVEAIKRLKARYCRYLDTKALLDYQRHDWPETIAWVAESQGRLLRTLLPILGPVLRPVMRAALAAQRRVLQR
jgi:hypothetical protein